MKLTELTEEQALRLELVKQAKEVSVHLMPALEEYILTGEADKLKADRRKQFLADLCTYRNSSTASFGEMRFINSLLALVYDQFPDAEIWDDEELKALVIDNPKSEY